MPYSESNDVQFDNCGHSNSRANAPTGSAGEESVSSLLLLLLLLLHCVLLAHARRARAPNTPPNTDSFGARARREPAHMRKGGSGAHKLSQNHGIYDVVAASEKTKIEDKDSEQAKTLYFMMFLACRVRKLAFRKVLKHRCLQRFVLPPKTKQR